MPLYSYQCTTSAVQVAHRLRTLVFPPRAPILRVVSSRDAHYTDWSARLSAQYQMHIGDAASYFERKGSVGAALPSPRSECALREIIGFVLTSESDPSMHDRP